MKRTTNQYARIDTSETISEYRILHDHFYTKKFHEDFFGKASVKIYPALDANRVNKLFMENIQSLVLQIICAKLQIKTPPLLLWYYRTAFLEPRTRNSFTESCNILRK